MKILMVNRALYPRDTAGMVMLRLADSLKEQRHKVLFLVQPNENNIRREGDTVIEVPPTDTRRQSYLHQRHTLRSDPGVAEAVTELVNEHQPDVALVFHVVDSLTWSVPATLARRGVPVLMMETDFSRCCPAGRFRRPINDIGGDLMRFFTARVPQRSEVPCQRCMKTLPAGSAERRRFPLPHGLFWCRLSHCVDRNRYRTADAHRTERYLRRLHRTDCPAGWLATSEHHAALIRCAIRTRRPVVSVDLPLPADAFESQTCTRGSYVLFAGTMSLITGSDDLLEAIACMEGKPVDAFFAGDGPDISLLMSRAEEICAERGNRIQFPGMEHVPALRRMIAESLALVVPTHCEEIAPWPVLEALAIGKPVIAAAVGVLNERVTDGCTGMLYPAGDVKALARCLAELRDLPDERYQELCAAAREEGRRYHPEAYARRVLDVIAERTGME